MSEITNKALIVRKTDEENKKHITSTHFAVNTCFPIFYGNFKFIVIVW